MDYLVRKRKVSGYSLWHKRSDGSESFIGDFRNKGLALRYGRLLAGWSGTVEVVK